MLHGYRQKGQSLYKRLKEILPIESSLLIPNGPFPLPYEIQQTQKMGYSWYFYDASQDHYLIDFKFPSELLEKLIQYLPQKFSQIHFIGFSQGGYLAPFIGTRFQETKTVISICASPRSDLFQTQYPFKLIGFNTLRDSYINFSKAKMRYKEFQKKLLQVEFHDFEGDHQITDKMKQILRNQIIFS